MTTPEMHTLAGAFAVDALSEHERARFQRHLEECESCAQEVRELRATAARLGAAEAAEPPPGLKAAVLAAVRETVQQPPSVEPPQERSRRSSRVPRWVVGVVAAAAIAGLALAGVFGGIALRSQGELTTAQQQIAQAKERYAPVAELLAAPDAKTVHGAASIGGGGTVVMSASLNKMMFMASRLPPHGEGRDYQVWLMTPGSAPRSAGVLPAGAEGGQLVLASGVDGTTQVALTLEPSGGSPAPTSNPVLSVYTA
ncbi:anti-sigma factor [Amycolatopsis minnesotensis]|uniref:Regulator of SigK n=1 Tax=Amycolatopsis minnesotensis TaxID=337894 RepID=A0ABN2Q4W3_9PSEU